jgi:hypothetical protein
LCVEVEGKKRGREKWENKDKGGEKRKIKA